jgi:hypothetical protein
MKLATSAIIVATSILSASAFAPNNAFARPSTAVMGTPGMDLSGNSWKPDSEKMGSTDTGDYFPEGYDPQNEVAFSDGMLGSQSSLGNDRSGPALPGMENLGADAVMMGGIEQNTEIPEGMEFVPATRADGEFSFQVAASSKGGEIEIEIKPFCMGFEDFYAAFAPGSHPSLSVSPCAGRMDRRGGESTFMTIACAPNGQAGTFTGDLVVNLPEDMSKLSYKVSVTSF